MSRSTTTSRVWDPLVRVFHWSLAAGLLVAWLSGDDRLDLHVPSGYLVLGLLLFRVVWGRIGTTHARFRNFVRSPSVTLAYLRDVLALRANRHLGHNPAGGAMVVALLTSLLATVLSGLAVYGQQEFLGPLAVLAERLPEGATALLEGAHSVTAQLTLTLVVLHLAGVALASIQHRENLVRSMITGNKTEEPRP